MTTKPKNGSEGSLKSLSASEIRNLDLSASAKQVIRDFYSEKEEMGEPYTKYLNEISGELKILRIYKSLKDRVDDQRLPVFITPKTYFVSAGLLDRGFMWYFDPSYTIHAPNIDIVLLGQHVHRSPAVRKRSSLHEALHVHFFHEHASVRKIGDGGGVDTFNRKIAVFSRLKIQEAMAELVPFWFPDIRPAYEGAEPTDEAVKILSDLERKGEAEMLKAALRVETVPELIALLEREQWPRRHTG